MPKQLKQRHPKARTTDVNQIAHQLVARSTEETQGAAFRPASLSEYLAAIGSKGGKASGKSRMEKIAPEKRREIALKAAQARWSKRKKEKS